MTRADVADYLGLTVETVSRSLSRLNSQHLIHLMDDKQVQLVDPAALSKIAVGI
jgi:CRP/FNR family transcriptional regulator